MQIKSFLKKLKRLNLTPNQYLYIYGLVNDCITDIITVSKCTEQELLDLQEKGILKIVNLTKLTFSYDENNIKKASKILDSEDSLDWISEWIALWPEGVKSGGYYIRSNESSIISKMKAFIDNYDYSPEIIIDSTRAYLQEMVHKGYKGVQCAHYFIEKNKQSNLEAYCRNFSKLPDHESRITHEVGINV
jgi:hypothetical protein